MVEEMAAMEDMEAAAAAAAVDMTSEVTSEVAMEADMKSSNTTEAAAAVVATVNIETLKVACNNCCERLHRSVL
jgi:hypothetical protein